MRMKFSWLLMLAIFASCKSKKAKENSESQAQVQKKDTLHTPDFMPGPHAMVYKTVEDYSNLVPIELDSSGQIISYPAPSDFKPDFKMYIPLALSNGYWLDRKGIGSHVAYLDWTVEEYVQMETVPTIETIKSHILVSEPLTELCDCGNASSYSDIVSQINAFILNDSLMARCKRIK